MKCLKKISLVALSVLAMGSIYKVRPTTFQEPQKTDVKVEGVHQIVESEAAHLSESERGQIKSVVLHLSREYHIDPLLILSVVHVESHFKPSAASNRGALGLMQIKPVVVRELSKRQNVSLEHQYLLKDNVFNLHVGVRYLSFLINKYHGDVNKALMAYNAGPTTVSLLYKNRPAPTGGYQGRVLKTYQRYAMLVL